VETDLHKSASKERKRRNHESVYKTKKPSAQTFLDSIVCNVIFNAIFNVPSKTIHRTWNVLMVKVLHRTSSFACVHTHGMVLQHNGKNKVKEELQDKTRLSASNRLAESPKVHGHL
jgi:hypothetical protein